MERSWNGPFLHFSAENPENDPHACGVRSNGAAGSGKRSSACAAVRRSHAPGEIDTSAYFFMYVRATLASGATAGVVDIKNRLVSNGGEPTETIELDLQRSFEQRGSLIRITRLSEAGSYVDNATLRGDTNLVQARRLSRGFGTSGMAVMAYIRDP